MFVYFRCPACTAAWCEYVLHGLLQYLRCLNVSDVHSVLWLLLMLMLVDDNGYIMMMGMMVVVVTNEVIIMRRRMMIIL